MLVKEIYSKLRLQHNMRKIENFSDLNSDTFYTNNFHVEIRQPQKGHIYLRTGKNSILGGSYLFEAKTGSISIGDRVHIGADCKLMSIDEITIEEDVLIAWNVLLYDNNAHSTVWAERAEDVYSAYINLSSHNDALNEKDWSKVRHAPIRICKKAWICANCTILKGVTIGEGAIVANGSVVVKDVEPWTLVGGNPASTIKKLK